MGAIRLVIVLLVAAVSSIVLFFVVHGMTAKRAPAPVLVAAPAKPTMARVLVAKHDLKVGQRLAPDDMAWQPWPIDAMNPAFVSGGLDNPKANIADKAGAIMQAVTQTEPHIQELTGALVSEPILQHEPISLAKLIKGGQGGVLAVKLPQGMRAMSMPVTVENGVGGFVLPGDHVDVVAIVKGTSIGEQGAAASAVKARTVLSNVKVLAVDQALEPKPGAVSVVGATATLQVAAADVDELAKAKEEGTLMLILRSYADMDGASGRVTPVRAPGRLRPATLADSIRIYRGDKAIELRVR
jgi:pilus assembly protein CpaB